jgi:hypothetical protein
MATREGCCYQHVQAITVAIDQYAEKALGNRQYFLNKPYSRWQEGSRPLIVRDFHEGSKMTAVALQGGRAFCEFRECQSVSRCRGSLNPSLRR